MGSSQTLTDTSSDQSMDDFDSSSSTHSSDNEAANNADSPPFAVTEKVLAFHNAHIYEAKVLQIDYKQDEWVFLVHYLCWKKSWDEWVSLDRLMKYTKDNLELKLAHEKEDMEKKAKAARASQLKSKGSNAAKGKKRKNEPIVQEKDAAPSDKFMSIHMPPSLKKQLVDDCEFVTRLGKLVKLPRTPNVNDIAQKYLDYWLKKDAMVADSMGEILKGLCCYFDKALPALLLYQNERKQYQEACPGGTAPCAVYGAEHLLRLFIKLPELLVHANIEKETMVQLQEKLADFLKFLQKNQNLFFLSTYHVPEDIENSTNMEED